MQHVQDEGDALAEGHEADHRRQDDGQQADDLIEYAGEHGAGDDGAESSSSGLSLLQITSLQEK